MHYAAKAAHTVTGVYYHMLPTQRQARKVVWNGIDKDGVRLIDRAFPKELRKRTLEDEQFIEFHNGSVWQAIGSDHYDSIVGTNPRGIVFSEWSISNPRAWDYMRPILTENGGWAGFIGTPRGKNFFFDQYKLNLNNPDWYVDLKTVEDTGAIALDLIDKERLAGMSEDRIQQEFYCSFDAQSVGYIYDSYVTAMEASGRLTQIMYDPRYPVETAWDLGHRDATAIWFIQRINNQVRVIDYHEERGKYLAHFINVVRSKPYVYSRHIGPHDTTKFEFGAGNTIQELARQHGFTFTIAPKLDVEDGIQAVRALLPRMVIDINTCLHAVRCLRNYRYDNDSEDQDDDKKVTLASKPLHDWSSHCCDALRYLAVTPEAQGIIPQWARETMGQNNWQHQFQPPGSYGGNVSGNFGHIGHGTGHKPWMHPQPTFKDPMDAYDPLAEFRRR